MGWTQYGTTIEEGQWQSQNDFFAEQADTGAWTATQSFLIKRSTLGDLTFRNEFRALRPATELDESLDDYWAFLKLHTVPRFLHIKGGLTRIVVKYRGYTNIAEGGATQTFPQYRLSSDLSDRPILEHPTVKGLALAQRLLLAGLVAGDYVINGADSKVAVRTVDESGRETLTEHATQLTAGDAANFGALIAKGEVTYKWPTFVWSKRWEDDSEVPAADLNDMGKVSIPDGPAPEPTGGSRDWLLTYIGQDLEADTYHNVLEWTLSDEDGWDADLYDY